VIASRITSPPEHTARAARWPLFAGVPEEDVAEVLSRARVRRFDRDQIVFHRDDPADSLHLVEFGRFAVEINLRGERTILRVLGPGESFGELALIEGSAPRSATVLALERSQTLSVHQHDFDRLRDRRPSVERVVSRLLAEQVRRLSGQLVEALHLPVEQRIRRRLLALVPLYGEPPTSIPITQQTLSELAGTTRQAVNTVLREDEAAGVLELGRGVIKVLDAGALEARSGRIE
jgi:CRP/FNR family transcriptional regulator, cyclic AMP receptor protein